MQEDAACDECFQGKNLVKSFGVFSFVDKVASYTEVDAEYRHGQFGTQGKSYGKLFAERRAVELFLVGVMFGSGYMVFQVGAFVVLCIQRDAGTEIPVDPVEWIEVEPDYPERAGYKVSLVGPDDASAPGGSV